MELSTRASGSTSKETVTACRSGLMALAMREIGAMVRLMAVVLYIMPTEMSTRENGSMIKLTVKEHTLTQTERSMLVTGRTTSSMDSDLRLGQMVLSMKESTTRARKMERAVLPLPMAQFMKENSK